MGCGGKNALAGDKAAYDAMSDLFLSIGGEGEFATVPELVQALKKKIENNLAEATEAEATEARHEALVRVGERIGLDLRESDTRDEPDALLRAIEVHVAGREQAAAKAGHDAAMGKVADWLRDKHDRYGAAQRGCESYIQELHDSIKNAMVDLAEARSGKELAEELLDRVMKEKS